MPLRRRDFLLGTAATTVAAPAFGHRANEPRPNATDYLIIGAGTAGLPAAIFASRRGASVQLVDAAPVIGGTLQIAQGQISGAGTRLQRTLGIEDTPELHYDDIMRVTLGTADPDIARLVADNAGATIDWLLSAGFTPLPGHPVTGASPGRPAYSRRRYLWGADAGRSILQVVLREIEPLLADGRIRLALDSRVTQLLVDDNGAVRGASVLREGRAQEFHARNVLLTCGGYAANGSLFRQLCGYPNYAGSAYVHSQGDGLALATSVGGYLRGREKYRSGFGSILADEHYPAKVYARFNTVPQDRPPWEIWVNQLGERFVREDEPDLLRREQSLLGQSELRYWIVFDEAILRAAPPGIKGWSREQLRAACNRHPMFSSASSVDALAQATGIDAHGLAATIAAYNKVVAGGRDPLGRRHAPHAISRGPFYAIRHQGHSATSVVGVTVDAQLRVLRGGGDAVENLYAAGEILGSGATMGKAFAAGMMLTPALTFGRLLGERLPI
ncbi:MAG: FAD-binding protein [Steroidobacteraceae bacterium]